jgi:uncharacterized protein (TIGR02453 family)
VIASKEEAMPKSLKTTFEFLKDLQPNNNKVWFDANRKRYQEARSIFEELIGDIMRQFDSVEDLGNTSVKECLYRFNRDIRFSKDKSPYNTHMGALIARGGRKSLERSYYIQIAPGESFIAGGTYAPSPQELQKIRTAVADNPQKLTRILADKEFVRDFGNLYGEKLKSAPKGYSSDHPAIELLKYKQFLALHKLTDEQILSDNPVSHIINVCKVLKPFVGYFTEAAQS